MSDTLYYLLTDHLGSTTVTTYANGAKVAEVKYAPWGEVRYTSGSTPTDYTFTGQYSNVDDIGLMYYNARWYDPALGRFAQADTIVPPGAQGYDRYAYVGNNPVNNVDPSGHKLCDDEFTDCRTRAGSSAEQPRTRGPRDDEAGPSAGDLAMPWDVGVEWITGLGPRHHDFGPGDPFTQLLMKHEYIQEVRAEIAQRLAAGNYVGGRMDYKLGGLEGIPKYARDYATLMTFGETGNLAATFLGSYDLQYSVIAVDADSRIAVVQFHVTNESTLASATHPPVIGYTDLWDQTVAPLTDSLVPTGPMSEVTQSFVWTESITFGSIAP